MAFDNRRGILGNPMGAGPEMGMNRGILGAPPGPMGMDRPGPVGSRGGGLLGDDLDPRIGMGMSLEEDLVRERRPQFDSYPMERERLWDNGSSGAYGNEADIQRMKQLQMLQQNFSSSDGILGPAVPLPEGGLPSRSLGAPPSMGMAGMGMEMAPRPLFEKSDLDRFRAAKILEAHSGRGRRRDRMDMSRARSPSPRRYIERSPRGFSPRRDRRDDYDPADPTGDGMEEPHFFRGDRRPMNRDRHPKSNLSNLGITVCHACHLDLGTNQRWRDHMLSEGHMMVMQELGCKAEEQAFHLKREMRDNLRKRRTSDSEDSPQKRRRDEESNQNEGTNYCKACEKEFFGPFLHHSSLQDHKKKQQMIRDGCRWCDVKNFDRFRDLQQHRSSEDHLQKQREHDEDRERRRQEYGTRYQGRSQSPPDRLRLNKDRTEKNNRESTTGSEHHNSGGEKDDDKTKPVEEAEPSDAQKSGGGKKDTEMREKSTERTEGRYEVPQYPVTTLADLPAEYNPNMALGQDCIKQVTGYFCRICRKFYSNQDLAFQNHCKSEVHFTKLKAHLQKSSEKLEASDED